jgi:hypothetical protein
VAGLRHTFHPRAGCHPPLPARHHLRLAGAPPPPPPPPPPSAGWPAGWLAGRLPAFAAAAAVAVAVAVAVASGDDRWGRCGWQVGTPGVVPAIVNVLGVNDR